MNLGLLAVLVVVAAIGGSALGDGAASDAILAGFLYGLGVFFPLLVGGAVPYLGAVWWLAGRVPKTVWRASSIGLSPLVSLGIAATRPNAELMMFSLGMSAIFGVVVRLPLARWCQCDGHE